MKPGGQLDRAGTANLIEGVEAATRAAGAQTACERLRRAAKEGAGQAVGGTSEVGVVQDVEEFGPAAKAQPLGEAKDALQADVRLCSIEAAQHVASEIALPAGGDWIEGCFIEDLASRVSRPVEFQRYSWIYIRAGIKRCARSEENAANYADGWS